MKTTIQIGEWKKGSAFSCPICNYLNDKKKSFYEVGFEIICNECGSIFILGEIRRKQNVFKAECINIENRKVKVQKVSTWKCPLCLFSNIYPYDIRLGDSLRCDKCLGTIMLDEKSSSGDRLSYYKFVLKK